MLPPFDDPELQALLGVSLPEGLLAEALTHRSYAYERGTLHNERLEWLGDAVLGLYVSDKLYARVPELHESDLSNFRARLVSRSTLAAVARDIGLGRWIRLGKGEAAAGGDNKASILANAVEALLGAVHMHGGQPAVDAFCDRLLGVRVAAALGDGVIADAKVLLAQLAPSPPVYVTEGTGEPHARRFRTRVEMGDVHVEGAEAVSKKEAEQLAAVEACRLLEARKAVDDEAPSDDDTEGEPASAR